MSRTAKVKLQLNQEEVEIILNTMREYTTVFNTVSKYGYENKTWNKVDIHRATYRDIRALLPNLGSALIQTARDCACDALKTEKLKTIPIHKVYS